MHGAFRKADRRNIKDYYLSHISSTNTGSEETIAGVSIFKGAEVQKTEIIMQDSRCIEIHSRISPATQQTANCVKGPITQSEKMFGYDKNKTNLT